MKQLLTILYLVSLSVALVACQKNSAPMMAAEATLAQKTTTQHALEMLPPPSQKVAVSVYSFMDLTGQHKPSDTSPQYSKAVTQGGLPILNKALLDAGRHSWFRVVERGGLNNLLQERKIIRSVREQFAGPDGKKLPPLGPMLYSGLILEGGVVAYESDVITGGIGARYLGIGASTEYRRDMVTTYLRAVSVKNGEVLLSVNTSKTIYSAGVSSGIYKFVSFDKLLEAETGFTVNEPPQLAVRQAIEKAVYALIMEGVEKKLWQFANPAHGQYLLSSYISQRDNGTQDIAAVNEGGKNGFTNAIDFLRDSISGGDEDAQDPVPEVTTYGNYNRRPVNGERGNVPLRPGWEAYETQDAPPTNLQQLQIQLNQYNPPPADTPSQAIVPVPNVAPGVKYSW